MKTFLWTTLFWIVAAIAALLCLGFGNLGTQVLDNGWMAKYLPRNVQTATCDPVVASAIENIDRCAAAETNGCYPVEENNETTTDDNTWLQQALSDVMENQQIIYNYLQEAFASTNQAISSISVEAPEVDEPVIDEKEQQRLELQAQIEALQAEMNNL